MHFVTTTLSFVWLVYYKIQWANSRRPKTFGHHCSVMQWCDVHTWKRMKQISNTVCKPLCNFSLTTIFQDEASIDASLLSSAATVAFNNTKFMDADSLRSLQTILSYANAKTREAMNAAIWRGPIRSHRGPSGRRRSPSGHRRGPTGRRRG